MNFKIISRPLFTIIFKLRNNNFKTRDFSPLIERVLAGVFYISNSGSFMSIYKTKYSRNLYLPILKFQEKTDEVTNKFLDKRKDSYQSKPQPLATVHIDEDLNEIKHTVC